MGGSARGDTHALTGGARVSVPNPGWAARKKGRWADPCFGPAHVFLFPFFFSFSFLFSFIFFDWNVEFTFFVVNFTLRLNAQIKNKYQHEWI
jgi:hypothetical protein